MSCPRLCQLPGQALDRVSTCAAMEQLKQLPRRPPRGALSLIVGACGCGVRLWGFTKAAVELGRRLRTLTGVVCTHRAATTAAGYMDPVFTTTRGQTVASALQTPMVAPNSQLRTVLEEFTRKDMWTVHMVRPKLSYSRCDSNLLTSTSK